MWLFFCKWLGKIVAISHYLSAVILINLWTPPKMRLQCEEFARRRDRPLNLGPASILDFPWSLVPVNKAVTHVCSDEWQWGLSSKQNNAFTLGIFFSLWLSWHERPVTAMTAALKGTHNCLKRAPSTALSHRWIHLGINTAWGAPDLSSPQSKQSAQNFDGYGFLSQMWWLIK